MVFAALEQLLLTDVRPETSYRRYAEMVPRAHVSTSLSARARVCVRVRVCASWKPKGGGSASRPPVCQFRFDRLLVGVPSCAVFSHVSPCVSVQVAFQRWSTEQIASNADEVLELMGIKGTAVADKDPTLAEAAPAPTAAKPSEMVSETSHTAQLLSYSYSKNSFSAIFSS